MSMSHQTKTLVQSRELQPLSKISADIREAFAKEDRV